MLLLKNIAANIFEGVFFNANVLYLKGHYSRRNCLSLFWLVLLSKGCHLPMSFWEIVSSLVMSQWLFCKSSLALPKSKTIAISKINRLSPLKIAFVFSSFPASSTQPSKTFENHRRVPNRSHERVKAYDWNQKQKSLRTERSMLK